MSALPRDHFLLRTITDPTPIRNDSLANMIRHAEFLHSKCHRVRVSYDNGSHWHNYPDTPPQSPNQQDQRGDA